MKATDEPMADNRIEGGRAKNRRVELVKKSVELVKKS
jgi:flagellar motor protein MotB